MLKEKYIGEAHLKEQPIKKIGLVIAPGAVTPEHLSDRVLDEVIQPAIDRAANALQEEINSIEISGLALSQELGNNPNIGISQKALTEKFNTIYSKTEIDNMFSSTGEFYAS